MPKRAPFSLAFDLPFDEAIAAARARKVVLPEAYYRDLPAERRRQAFTVSGLSALDQVQAVLDQLARHLEEGGTFADFKRWAAWQTWELPKHRLETTYRSAVQGAYNAGHLRRFEESKEALPYLMYDAVNDSRTRPAHRAMDGIIRPVDDPFWHTHSPPNGFNCRCSLIALDADEASIRSRDGRGLNQPETPEMRADDAGWGRKPTEWDETLGSVKAKKLARAAPALATAAQDALAAAYAARAIAYPEDLAGAAGEFLAAALRAPGHKQRPLMLAPVGLPVAVAIETLGASARARSVALDHDSTLHIHHSHGNEKEKLRGQEPIGAEDLALAPILLERAMSLLPGTPSHGKSGAMRVEVYSEIGEWRYWSVFEVRRHVVVPITIYKREKK